MFGYLASFVYSTEEEQPVGEHILSTLWYCKKVGRVLDVVDKMTQGNKQVPLVFLKQLTEEKVASHTYKIIKELLTRYNAPSWGVCKQVADMLSEKFPCIANSCSLAIGSEKVKWNKEFYHKIRVLKSKEMKEWRKELNSFRKGNDFVIKDKIIKNKKRYTLGLFNEPLFITAVNPSENNPILSLYKGIFYKNKTCRTPIELSLDDPLTQKDLTKFISQKDITEDLVIIVQSIDKNVVPPKGVYIVFMDYTLSFGDGIYPYIDNVEYSVLGGFFEMI